MEMAINLTTKYSPVLDERFRMKSLTDSYAGKKYDFAGVRSIRIYTVDRVTLNDYNREASANRFGIIKELGDTVQELTMSQDKSFTFAIDYGNAADQLNIKRCNEQLKAQWDEVVTPEIDMYRLRRWINGAGLGTTASAPSKTNIIETIMKAGAALSNRFVPKANRVLFISETLYIQTKLANEIIGIDTLGRKAVANGVVGFLDGTAIIPIPDSYLPVGVHFLVKYKDSTVDPLKIKVLRVQKRPLGFDADVGECRFYHDAFVLGEKAYGLYVHALADAVCATPTGDAGTTTVGRLTLSTTTSGATIKYTMDGSNPKVSLSAKIYNGSDKPALPTAPGQYVIKAYATKEGLIDSPILEIPYTVS